MHSTHDLLRRSLVASAILGLLVTFGAPRARAQGAGAANDRTVRRSVSLPYRGLFEGDRLSAAGRDRLVDLVIEARGLDIEVALLVPTGAWRVEGNGDDERRLTPARLESIRRYLVERGVDPKRIYVESRIDARLGEPVLLVELVGRPGRD